MKRLRNNHNEDTYDELIKIALEKDLSKDDEIIVPTDEEIKAMGYPTPGADTFDRIMEKYEFRVQHGEKKNNKKVAKLFAIVAIIAATICGGLSVQAVRVYLFKIVNQITDNSIKIFNTNEMVNSFDTDESEAYKNAEDAMGISLLKPYYLPDGMDFNDIKIYVDDHVILNYRNEGKIIRFTQALKENAANLEESIDTLKGDVFTKVVGDKDITFAKYIQEETEIIWYEAVWSDDELYYYINTNVDEEELNKIIENLRK